VPSLDFIKRENYVYATIDTGYVCVVKPNGKEGIFSTVHLPYPFFSNKENFLFIVITGFDMKTILMDIYIT